MGGFAWVTLATNDSYSLGALVLANSLKQVGTNQQLAVLVTPGVTDAMRAKLASIFNVVQEVNILDSRDETNLRLLKRPELGVTFTKLHCWRLTQYDKCVFLDADTLVLQNCDELFDREELSAAPDVGWPDCFNSGVFVYRPSNDTYEKLIQFALDKGSFDGGDQGLLNLYFSDWAHKDISKHLPFIYNMCSTACYSYLPAFKQFGNDAKIVHFIGPAKPWLQYFDTETKKVHPSGGLQHLHQVLQRWWDIFCSLIHPNLSSDMARSTSDVTHTNSSRHVPQNYSNFQPIPYRNPNESSGGNDYRDVWDPWEEYYKRETENTSNPVNHFKQHHTLEPLETKPIESHNTNAWSDSAALNNPEPMHSESLNVSQHTSSPPQFIFSSQHSILPPEDTSLPYHSNIQCDLETRSHVNPEIIVDQSAHTTDLHHTEFHSHSSPPCHANPISDSISDQSIPEDRSHPPRYSNSITTTAIPKSNSIPPPVVVELTPKSTVPAFTVLPSECQATKETTMHTITTEDQSNAGLAGAFAQLTLGAPRTAEQSALDDHLRRQGWEVGNIDYLGRDSFENIWSKICETLATAATPPPPPPASSSSPTPQKPKEPTPPPVTEPKEQVAAEVSNQKTPMEAVQPEPQSTSLEAPKSQEAPQVPIQSEPSQNESVTIPEDSKIVIEQCELSKIPDPEGKSPQILASAKDPQSVIPLPEVLEQLPGLKTEGTLQTGESPKTETFTDSSLPASVEPTASSEALECPIPKKSQATEPPQCSLPPDSIDSSKGTATKPTEISQQMQESIKSSEIIPSTTLVPEITSATPITPTDSKESVELPKPIELPKSEETKPTETSHYSEPVKSAEAPAAILTEGSQVVGTSEETHKPAASVKSKEDSITSDAAKSAETLKSAEAPITADITKPVESFKAAEASKSEAFTPTEATKILEAPISTEATKPEASSPAEAIKPSETPEATKSAEVFKSEEVQKETAITLAEAAKSVKASEPAGDTKPADDPKLKEAPKLVEDSKTAEVPKPVEAPKPTEALESAEDPKPGEVSKPIEITKLAEAPKTAEIIKSTESFKSEVKGPIEAVKTPEAPTPAQETKQPESKKNEETLKPLDTAKPVEAVKPTKEQKSSSKTGESQKSAESSKPEETSKSTEETKKQEAPKQAAAESSMPTPTPPPRKGSGGPKKSSKQKK